MLSNFWVRIIHVVPAGINFDHQLCDLNKEPQLVSQGRVFASKLLADQMGTGLLQRTL